MTLQDNRMACFAVIPSDLFLVVLDQETDLSLASDVLPIVLTASKVRSARKLFLVLIASSCTHTFLQQVYACSVM